MESQHALASHHRVVKWRLRPRLYLHIKRVVAPKTELPDARWQEVGFWLLISAPEKYAKKLSTFVICVPWLPGRMRNAKQMFDPYDTRK